MQLTERHIIKSNNPLYRELENITFKSKNLYNTALYLIRQEYFNNKKYYNYNKLCSDLIKSDNIDYYAMPTKVSQQTLRLLDKNFKSFFSKNKLKLKQNKIPKYLDKNGKFICIFTIQAISKKELKNNNIKLSGIENTIKTKVNIKDINQVRVIPKGNHFIVEVIYEIKEKELKKDNNRYCSIDLGINNLATISSNVIKPVILNGKPIKSINQFYNKRISKLKSKNKNKSSKRINAISLMRNNKITDYLHKSSKYIINHLVSNNINTLIIGKNIGWKQEINIGRINNQKFVNIPFNKFTTMLMYKCKLEGINVILTEESYTSKCSFLDNEDIKKQEKYQGKRIKRGLFKSKNDKLINADLNGSLNILKKVIGEFQYPIEVCSTPMVITIKLN